MFWINFCSHPQMAITYTKKQIMSVTDKKHPWSVLCWAPHQLRFVYSFSTTCMAQMTTIFWPCWPIDLVRWKYCGRKQGSRARHGWEQLLLCPNQLSSLLKWVHSNAMWWETNMSLVWILIILILMTLILIKCKQWRKKICSAWHSSVWSMFWHWINHIIAICCFAILMCQSWFGLDMLILDLYYLWLLGLLYYSILHNILVWKIN